MQEIWKDIPNYEGLYQVSNLGSVKSLLYAPRLMRTSKTNCGYLKVQLYANGKPKMKYVHRLVAEAFIPNPEGKKQVNHIDGDKTNNAVSNLEWASASDNQLHAINHNLRASSPMTGRTGKLNPNSRPILQYDLDGNLVKRWPSIADAGRYFGNSSPISNCLCGRYKTSYGYKWEYE